MITDPKDKKKNTEKDTDEKEVAKQPEQPEYDDTVDYKDDDKTDINKDEYFEK